MSPTTKRVHFAVSNTYYTIPETPSPSFSDISLPDEEGPITPPQTYHQLPQLHSDVLLHGALALRPGAPATLQWNVAHGPSTIILNPALHSAPGELQRALLEPATSPPLPSMTLVTDLLPYPIIVHAGAGAAGGPSPYTPLLKPLPSSPDHRARNTMPYVTVNDVVCGLYGTLRLPVTPAEYRALPPARQYMLDTAYKARIAAIADPARREADRPKGIKRVDFLLAAGVSRFVGVERTKRPNVWALRIA